MTGSPTPGAPAPGPPTPRSSRPGAPPRWLRLLVRLVLRAYPQTFRRELGRAYREAAEHRWRRDVAGGTRGRWRRAGAALRLAGFLVADAARAAPGVWRERLGNRRRTPGPGARGTDARTGGGVAMRWIEGWLWDLRVAARSLIRRPGPSALVVGTLALGIGADAAVFGVLDRVVLNPFPFEHGDRMAYVAARNVETGFSTSPTQEELEGWRERARTVEALEVLRGRSGTLYLPDGHERVEVLGVSGGMTGMVGLRPVAGRAFGPADAEPGAPRIVMLHEDFWRSAFGADADVIGRTFTLDDRPATVIGVWPRGARLRVEASPDVYEVLARGQEVDRSYFTQTLALLRPGVGAGEVEAELRALQAAMDEARGSGPSRYVPSLRAPHDYLGPAFSRGLWVLFAGGGLLLVGAAVNASNLLLNRAVDREGELGVRLALGGSALRLLRTFVLESVLVVGAGAVLGLVLAAAGGAALATLAPGDMPASALSGVGGRVPLYAVSLVALTSLVCGLVPAAHLRSPRVRRLMQSRGVVRRDRGLLRPALVAVQVTLAAVLLVGSALTARSFRALHEVDPGFALEAMATVSVRAPASRFASDADRAAAMDRVGSALAGLPGVTGVDASGTYLLSYSLVMDEPVLEGDERRPDPAAFSATTAVEEDFFDVLGIPLLEGRGFTPAETRAGGPRVVVVNDAFARRYPEGVVGRELLMRTGDTTGHRIVGVVGSVSAFSLEPDDGRIQVYFPDRPGDEVGEWARFNLRVEGDAARVLALAGDRIRGLDRDLVITEARTGRDVVREETADHRFLALLLAGFGGLSLVLALAGVYGALSLQVTRRTRELGLRMALGADRGRLLREVVARGGRPVVVGTLLGTGAAALLSRQLEAVLFQVSPVDPVSFAAGAAVLLAAATGALLLPARRATRVEPTEALRSE